MPGGHGHDPANANFNARMMQMEQMMMSDRGGMKELPKLEISCEQAWKKGLRLVNWIRLVQVHTKACNLRCGEYVKKKIPQGRGILQNKDNATWGH